MPRIDRYIDLLFDRQGESLTVATGERVTLACQGERQAITGSAAPFKAVEALLAEVVPPDLAGEVEQDGEHGFSYGSPRGEVLVTVRRGGETLSLQLAPAGSSPGGSAPVAEPEPAVAVEPEPVAAAPAAASEPAPVDAPSELTMDALLLEMVREGCSDLHLSSDCPPFFRKDGAMTLLSQRETLDAVRVRELLLSITPPRRRDEFETRHDTDFSYEIEGVGRFRSNLFMDRKGIGGVFRVIPTDILTAEDLNLAQPILDLCHLSKGLIVVTGPTGSGKSTTLAAMIDYVNRNRADHIITIEDPIEFVHPNKGCLINQREIGDHTQGFKAALRAALREDPDIVLVGEMRDLETVEIALETAETGHLVFGTLHTNTAASTVDRLIDQFPADRQGQVRTMLAESLRGVIAQTLCKRKGGGRIAALETLIVTAAVSNLIREGKTFQIPSVMQTGRKLGMVTLNDGLLDLIERDQVEPDQALAKAVDRDAFRSTLSAKGIALAPSSA